ncbi:hypothetical protein PR048_027052 [Dryococelus australis]|uniref:Uncharacterized protein n=1 Tax=Dryococelus australis TaxID=614101 RepID=A0ABQ9GEK6_9NEOP|nr:hypothetical protein PR048_027052 [Dryococelus australis]
MSSGIFCYGALRGAPEAEAWDCGIARWMAQLINPPSVSADARLHVGAAARLPVGAAARLPVGAAARLPVGAASRLPVGAAACLPVCAATSLPVDTDVCTVGCVYMCRVTLGNLNDFLSTSCITNLSFLGSQEEGLPDSKLLILFIYFLPC